MTAKTTSQFRATLQCPVRTASENQWAFVVLPRANSDTLPRRGRTSIDGKLNGFPFQATLEPDGQLSHWLKISATLLEAAGVEPGEEVSIEIKPVEKEPEPEVPEAFMTALAQEPEAFAVWNETTTIARLDWIHWITSAKQEKTRLKRIHDACQMLASGKKRVCCFDPSGFYSKAFSAPEATR